MPRPKATALSQVRAFLPRSLPPLALLLEPCMPPLGTLVILGGLGILAFQPQYACGWATGWVILGLVPVVWVNASAQRRRDNWVLNAWGFLGTLHYWSGPAGQSEGWAWRIDSEVEGLPLQVQILSRGVHVRCEVRCRVNAIVRRGPVPQGANTFELPSGLRATGSTNLEDFLALPGVQDDLELLCAPGHGGSLELGGLYVAYSLPSYPIWYAQRQEAERIVKALVRVIREAQRI